MRQDNEETTTSLHLLFCAMIVERVKQIGYDVFYKDYVHKNKPVIITDVVTEWRAFIEWTQESFKQKYGYKQAGIMRLKNGRSDADTYSEAQNNLHAVADIIASVQKGIENADMVLASDANVLQPEINEDVKIPSYCKRGRFFRNRIYVGPKGLVTTLHQDLPENLYAIISGAKHITLYPPANRKWLYPNPPLSKHPNFARFNPDQPDYKLYPLAIKAMPIEVYLKAGEMLFIPSLWWHHIRNTTDSIAMNFWWSVGWKVLPAWVAAKLKKMSQ